MMPYCILAIDDDDDRAFMEELFLHYKRLMYHEIYKILKHEWNTEDVMQATLEKLIEKLPLLRCQTRDQRVNYIISACKNTAYNHLRDGTFPQESSFEDYRNVRDDGSGEHMIELHLVRKEELDRLARVWPRLDEYSRRVLEGYYVLEKSVAELGQELGIKPGSVRMALTRARNAAYKLLDKELETQR